MARKRLKSMVPQAQLAAANVALCAIVEDDPGTIETELNAYLEGADPAIATHAVSNWQSLTQAQADAMTNYLTSNSGGSLVTPYTDQSDFWAAVYSAWGLLPVVP